MWTYSGDYAQNIAFPLSGIGTGGLSISGIGRLIDWELNGRANKGKENEYSHFALKAERDGKVIDARVLQGDQTTELFGSSLASHHHSWGYGQGVNRTTLAGLSHFPDTEFTGEFPFASLKYHCDAMPAEITLNAWNPFIPGDGDNSSLPVAFFDWTIRNTSEQATDYTLAFSVGNPFRISENGCAEYSVKEGLSCITLRKQDQPEEGALAVSTDCPDVSFQEYWYRGRWFDDVTTYWREFSSFGKLKNRHYDDNGRRGQLDIGDTCTLAAHISLCAGETKKIRFLLAWYFPNFVKYWDASAPVWRHEYARRFSSVSDVLRYCHQNAESLYTKSDLFRKALCAMNLPGASNEAAADNLCVLKSPTCLRLENGEFYAFEGTGATEGSCEGTCDHVWGYQYALPFLFPEFARQTLEIDYTYNMKESGEMMFRTMLPLGSGKSNFRACVDGQMGCVLRFYREWKLSGDDKWLKKWWPKVQKSIEYAWNPENRDRWDPERSGVITGRQHHTLDMELFGANSWLNGFYLAALKAGAEIAEYLGEVNTASEYRAMLENGQTYMEKELFNGKHYIQKIDLKDPSVIERFAGQDPGVNGYWNQEKNEIKYQYASGCEIDQMLAQWHASLIGLGDIFDPEHRKTAAGAMYDINFKSMREINNPCRIFAVNDEKGMMICEWAENEYKPQIPIPYTEEFMTGFEYAAAGLMIQNGLLEEGVGIIDAIRDRYDGKKRNPFSEIECGASYARSMASFALPALFAGYRFDRVRGEIGFKPVLQTEPLISFWSVDGAWGNVIIRDHAMTVCVSDGQVELNAVGTPSEEFANRITRVECDGKQVLFETEKDKVLFHEKIRVKKQLVFIA